VSDPRVGIVGLGWVGSTLARVLAGAGYQVAGHDVRPEAVAELAGVVTALASGTAVSQWADVVLVVPYDDEQTRAVVESVLAAPDPARIVAILSTVTIDTVRWAHARADRNGVALLDCGLTGGQGLRAHGTAVILAGGDEAALEAVRPVLETFAAPLMHMGPSGTGMQAKLARNVIHYGTWHTAWEGARLAAACGIGLDKLIDAVRASDVWSGGTMGLLAEGFGPGPVDRGDDDALHFARYVAGVARKDLDAALELAAEVGVDLPGAEVARQAFPRVTGLSEP
jgi:3-hydroxyisobutyrate dehydrogenase-like beta-hydroxyacid dehydrogenase